jgi:hypothetical protein
MIIDHAKMAGLPEIRRSILGGDFTVVEKELDLEWIHLIKEAMSVGVTKDEILEYLHTNREEQKVLVK